MSFAEGVQELIQKKKKRGEQDHEDWATQANSIETCWWKLGKEVTVFIQIIIRPPDLGRNSHVSSRDLEWQLATIYGPFPLSFEGGSDLYRGEM